MLGEMGEISHPLGHHDLRLGDQIGRKVAAAIFSILGDISQTVFWFRERKGSIRNLKGSA